MQQPAGTTVLKVLSAAEAAVDGSLPRHIDFQSVSLEAVGDRVRRVFVVEVVSLSTKYLSRLRSTFDVEGHLSRGLRLAVSVLGLCSMLRSQYHRLAC